MKQILLFFVIWNGILLFRRDSLERIGDRKVNLNGQVRSTSAIDKFEDAEKSERKKKKMGEEEAPVTLFFFLART